MDDDQQFCLRWNNHQSTLISVFDTLLENGTLVDCTLAAEGKFLKAHKVVLSACSPYFAALLSQQYDKHPIFILKDVKFQELRAMMDYMYRGEVNISQDQLAALLKAAESLQIKGLSDNRNNSMSNKTDNIVKPPPPPPVPASALKGGLVASDMKSTIPREGSTSPSRKRKKIGRRRSIGDANNVLDNHEHSNSSSHSHTTPHIAAAVNAIAAVAVGNNNIATSTPIVLPVTKKTDHDQNKTADAAGIDGNSTIETLDENTIRGKSVNDGKRNTTSINEGSETHSELMIEPKNEYEEEDDDDGNEPVEDLTLDDEEMMEDMDQAGPSHGGEGSSSGYANWQMERSGDEGFMVGQDGGQQRDAQAINQQISRSLEKNVLTLTDLNDCLLESNDIVVSKTKTGIVLLKLKKEDESQTHKSQQLSNNVQHVTITDGNQGMVFKECEIRPISTRKAKKNVEKSDVSITPCSNQQISDNKVVTSTDLTKQHRHATQTTTNENTITPPIIPTIVKKVCHPRIKYSKLVNPTAQINQQSSFSNIQQNIVETASHITLQAQAQSHPQQYFIARKILPVQSSPIVQPAATTTTTTTRLISNNNALSTQLLKVFTDYEGNTVATLPTTLNTCNSQSVSGSQAAVTDFAVGIVDDLDYTGIDDIELPDDVHFTDSFKSSGSQSSTFKGTHHEQSNNSISSNSNDPSTVLHSTGTDKYTIFQDEKYETSHNSTTIHLSENSMSDADESKQYACQHCGKRYRWKSTLRRHENVECGGKEASHQCPYCPYKAKQRGNLGVHVRKHHSNLPPLLTRRNKKALMATTSSEQCSGDEYISTIRSTPKSFN